MRREGKKIFFFFFKGSKGQSEGKKRIKTGNKRFHEIIRDEKKLYESEEVMIWVSDELRSPKEEILQESEKKNCYFCYFPLHSFGALSSTL